MCRMLFLLLMAAGLAHAAPLPMPARPLPPAKIPPGWTWVAGGGDVEVFTHSALGKPPPGLVKVWVLYSFRSPKGPPGPTHLSAKTLEFHSCANGTFAVGTTIKYGGPLGEGAVVETLAMDAPKQLEIPPDTASAWVWKSVCAP